MATLKPLEVPVAGLTPYPRNPRNGDTDAIRESLLAHGQYRPIVVRKSTGEVLAGNHTYAAALELGWDRVAVTYVDVDDDEAARIVLVDNRTNDLARYDDGELAALLESLPDLDGTGYDQGELDRLVAQLDRDAAPSPNVPPADPVTAAGDLILLGDHRLLCGDATSPDAVARLLDGAAPELTVTDPPYGVEYNAGWRNDAAAAGNLAYAARRVGEVANDDRVDWREAFDLSPSAVVYCWHASLFAGTVTESLAAAGFEARGQIVWVKPTFAIGRSHYHWRHENCLYAVRRGHAAGWIGGRSQSTVWEVGLDANVVGGHSTQKPVEVMAIPIRNHTGGVYDPFAGSGTTLVAAEDLHRPSWHMEIDPAYCDVIVDRWEAHTGQRAVRP